MTNICIIVLTFYHKNLIIFRYDIICVLCVKGVDTLSKTITNKVLCFLCCVLLIFASMPYTDVSTAKVDEGMIYVLSRYSHFRFGAYMPHSLSQANQTDRCAWFKVTETFNGSDDSNEVIFNAYVGLTKKFDTCTLLKSVLNDHLNHIKKDVYHLLI